MTFSESISVCLSKFFDSSGRASREEFWWFYLFTLLMAWGAILVEPQKILATLVNLIFLFPTIAVGSRRLHDTDRSGYWQFLLLTVIGVIPLIIWWSSEGSKQKNKYGEPI